MEQATLRLKLWVNAVKRVCNPDGSIDREEVAMVAVYDSREETANAQWSKWTPAAALTFTVSNPAALGKVLPGQFFFVDLIPTDKDSL